jgi:hypothetical protein
MHGDRPRTTHQVLGFFKKVRTMPITFQIDHERRRVTAIATGIIGEHDLIEYQQNAWSQPAIAGFDELLDASQADKLLDINPDSLRKVALQAAAMDAADKPSKFAIVAPQDAFFGLGRMYEALRSQVSDTLKEVSVFHSREDAEQWLQSKAD